MNKKGFTLIELILVVSIIGVLATIIIIQLGSARLRARDARRTGDLKQMGTALELFYADQNNYPIANNLTLGLDNARCLNKTGWNAPGCADPYMGIVPKDVQNNAYIYNSDGSTYTIAGELEGSTGNLPAGPIIQSPSGLHPGP